VQIDLIVRGACALRPGVKGLSQNIRVRSIVGRFLEHSRIFYFENGGQPEVYLASADWMPRNLYGRVELMFRISDGELSRRIHEQILTAYLKDNEKARHLRSNGQYLPMHSPGSRSAKHPAFNAQEYFLHLANGGAPEQFTPARAVRKAS